MIRVYIVEDHNVVVEGIRVLLQKGVDISIVGSATTAAACLDFLSSRPVDVVLMDINLPDTSGVDLCGLVKAKYKNVMVLGLSTFSQGIYMNKLMENGASGYLLKNITRQELIDGIRTANNGGIYFSFEVGKIYKNTLEKQHRQPVLTRREKEIVRLIADGLTNAEISRPC